MVQAAVFMCLLQIKGEPRLWALPLAFGVQSGTRRDETERLE
jgi:hypothetical protein